MKDGRVLRERKKVVNYDEGADLRKTQPDGLQFTRSRRVPDDRKENCRKRERSPRRVERDNQDGGSDDSDGDDLNRHPAKRTKSPPRSTEDDCDAIEDSDNDDNLFLSYARPGKRPEPAKVAGRPSRAAATKANRRISAGAKPAKASARDEEDDVTDEGRRRRPARTAAEDAKRRIQRGAGAMAVEDDDDEESEDVGADPVKDVASTDDGVVMISSESDDHGEQEDDEGDAEVVTRQGSRGRPARACVARQATRAGATTRGGQRDSDSEAEDSDDEGSSEEEEEEEEPQQQQAKTRRSARAVISSDESGDEESDGNGSEDEGEDTAQDMDVDDAGGKDGQQKDRKKSKKAPGAGGSTSDNSDVQIVEDDDGRDAADASCSAEEDGDEEDEEEEVRVAPRRAGASGRPTRGCRERGEERTRLMTDFLHKKRGPKPEKEAKEMTKADKGSKDKENEKKKKKKMKEKKKEKKKEKTQEKILGSDGKKKGHSKTSVEKILSYDAEKDMYLVKFDGMSYRHTGHVTRVQLESKKPQLLRMFLANDNQIEVEPEWLLVDRVIAKRIERREREYLVKWRGLEYSDSTWEKEADLTEAADKAAIERFKHVNKSKGAFGGGGDNEDALRDPEFQLPTFRNGRSLRDYQQVSVRWMVNNYCQRRNCILGDEMGLGKTAQSTSVLETLRAVGGVPGPFLVVAPLTTLGHWQREIETWTDMHVVLYAGMAPDRAIIVEHEMFRDPAPSATGRGRPKTAGRPVKFDVLLTSYDYINKDRVLFKSISWSAAIFDEAHKLKGINSTTRAAVKELDMDWFLLLTGTPIQNNIMELYAMLNLLDPEEYPSAEDFQRRFGGAPGAPPPNVDQIKALQAALAPILLRRMKEDVETLPEKEEVVIWVELTALQRTYYRSLYEGQISALLGGGRNLPCMRNLAMELRKLCCHPILCNGLEEDMREKLAMQRSLADAPQEFPSAELELLVRGSGKMVLLHKLLPKLRAEGRRVLIFSQFVIMLNVLEDYCRAAGFPVERIDGSIKGRARQQAIDRFSSADANDDSAFVFLLSTRAGGQGITLTAADTCIIYDSDWNPQNDLQAMARCHRIGQKKEVTVYRLISRDTYEMALFSTASKKYGLDEAILGFSAGTDPEADAARISELLRHGAHGLLSDMEAGAKQGEAFAGEDINQILNGRTEKRQIGSRAGNTFSVATFAVEDEASKAKRAAKGRAAAAEDEEYWRSLLPEAVAAHEAKANEGPVVLGPRKRKQVNYNLQLLQSKKYRNNSSDSDSEYDDKKEAGEGQPAGEHQGTEGAAAAAAGGKKRKSKKQAGAEQGGADADGKAAEPVDPLSGRHRKGRWAKAEVRALELLLFSLGPGRWDELFNLMQPTKRTVEEVEEVGRLVWDLYGQAKEVAAERERKRFATLLSDLDSDSDDPGVSTGGAAEDKGEKAAQRTTAAADAGRSKAADASREQPDGEAAGPSSAAAGGGAGGGMSAAARALGNFEEIYEQKMMEVLDKLPETIRGVMNNLPVAKKLLRDAQDNIRHAKMMLQLAEIMRPKKGEPQVEGEAPAATGGCKAGYVSTWAGIPHWWRRDDDEALLMAAVEVGYASSTVRRTLDYALSRRPLSNKVVLDDSQPAEPAAAGTAGADADDAGMDDGAKAEAQGGPDADVDMADAGAAAAAPAPKAPAAGAASGGPQKMSLVEWRKFQSALSRRLARLVPVTIDFQARMNGAKSSVPPPQHTIMASTKPAAPKPRSQIVVSAPAGGAQVTQAAMQQLRPTMWPAQLQPQAKPQKPVEGQQQYYHHRPAQQPPQSQLQAVRPLSPIEKAVATILSAAADAQLGDIAQAAAAAIRTAGPSAVALTAKPSPPVGQGHGSGHRSSFAPEVPRAVAPPAAAAVVQKPQPHAAPGDAGAGRSGGAKKHEKRQSTLPFARLSMGKTSAVEAAENRVVQVKPANAGVQGGVTPAPAAGAKACVVAEEPGSAERPIEVGDSD